MSATRIIHRFESGATSQTFAMGDLGGSVVRGMKIFKAGTFKDGLGVQKNWTVADLNAMAQNFATLRDRNIFSKVPMRVDHSESARSVVGWLQHVYVAGDFLVADVEFTEPDAAQKYSRGTYGPRSLEVGTYETNGDKPETFYPTVMGLAFVDIPAVEGLHGRASEVSVVQVLVEGTKPMPTEPAALLFKLRGTDESDHAKVQAHIEELEKRPEPFTFKMHGEDATDFAKVQAHIDTLEKAADEAALATRRSFVKALVDGGQVAAPQGAAMTELVEGMSPEQFEKFQKSYEGAPKLSLFQRHADGITSPTGDNDPKAEAIKTAEATVNMLRRSGRYTQAALKETAAFQKLTELKSAQ